MIIVWSKRWYLLGAVEGTNGRDSEGLLKGFNSNVGEVGGLPIRISVRVRIVHQNLHKSQR